jgi:DNA-binding FrmR family transcriptional regulator
MNNESLTQLKNILTLVDALEKNVTNNTDTKNIVEQIGAIKAEITNILNRQNF